MRSCCWVLSFSLTILVLCSSRPATANDAETLADKAMRAAVNGDPQSRSELLVRALSEDPNDESARWQAGYIRQAGKWIPVRAAESLNAVDQRIVQYEKLRDRVPDTLAGNVALAQWCRRNQLSEREQMHWRNVIQLDRNHQQARTRLHLREFRGQLMTSDEIKAWKIAMARYEVAQRKWNPRVNRLHRKINQSRVKRESDAWFQLAEINDPDAVPSLEKLIRRAAPVIQLHVIDTIATIEAKVAVDALVRLSLDLDDEVCRERASAGLRQRSWYAFVPQYLSALESPIEYNWVLSNYGDMVTSHLSLRQERPDDVVNVMHSRNSSITMLGPPGRQDVRAYRLVVAQEARRQRQELGNTMRHVDANNVRAMRMNQRIYAALGNSTGQQIDPLPHLWWDWWKQRNEYEIAEDKQERLVTLYENRQESIPAIPLPPGAHECFPAGTPVRTEVGLRSIESLRRGDRVLSQHVGDGGINLQIGPGNNRSKTKPVRSHHVRRRGNHRNAGSPFLGRWSRVDNGEGNRRRRPPSHDQRKHCREECSTRRQPGGLQPRGC